MGSVELLGITESSDNPRYSMALRKTAGMFVEAIKVLEDPATISRKDWKKKSEHKGDVCFNKHLTVGKCYTLRKEFPAPGEMLFRTHWDDIEQSADWNPNVHSVRKVHTFSSTADIIHYATSDVVVVKGRDFVVCRMNRKVGDSWYVVASSFDNDIPSLPKKKRAWVNVIAGKFSPVPGDANRCTVDYLVSVEFPGISVPKAVVSTSIADMVIKDARCAMKQLQKEIDGAEKKKE